MEPTLYSPQLPPPVPQNDTRFRVLGIILGLVILIAAAVVFFGMKHGSILTQNAVPSGSRLEFQGGESAAWYEVEGAVLAPVSGPTGFEKAPVTVIENATVLANGDTPVLARIAGQKGVVLGLLRKDGSFLPLLSDGTEKEALFVRPDGLAVFSTPVAPAKAKTASSAPPPVVISPQTSAVSWGIELMHLSGSDRTAKSLGEGTAIGISGDGRVLAVSTEGFVGIDPLTGVRHTIIASAAPITSGALSKDGTELALLNPLTEVADLYRIKPLQPTQTIYRYSTPNAASAVAFAVNGALLVRTKTGKVEAYTDTGAKLAPKAVVFTIAATSK